jgi:hypothetical protein
MRIRTTEKNLTGTAGLVPFGAYTRDLGIDRILSSFNRLKSGPSIVYPMAAQMRMLIDLAVVGEARVFALESFSTDPLFVHLNGGQVPSLDTCYRDLQRFDQEALAQLHDVIVEQGIAPVLGMKRPLLHIDIDSTVEPLFGSQEGALPGYNPRYHGRPSYHPILMRIAETDTVVGALLRPGNTTFGEDDVPWIEARIDNIRKVIGPDTVLYARIDAGGDCTAILNAITDKGVYFVVKAKRTADLLFAVYATQNWRTVDVDADGKARVQVAEIPFVRSTWGERRYRVIAVRMRERECGEELFLWEGMDMSVQIFITNEWVEAPQDVAQRYNLRAGIEPLIGELKHSFGIGKVPSQSFEANHAMLLLKLLAFNLMRRYTCALFPELKQWRAPWLRRALVLVPGILVYSGRSWTLRVPERSMLSRLLN